MPSAVGGTPARDLRKTGLLFTDHLSLNRLSREVQVDDAPVELTNTPFRLLEYLMLNEHKVVERDELLQRVWGIDTPEPEKLGTLSRRIDREVSTLRVALEEALPERFISVGFIETKHGVGYRFIGPVSGR